MMPAPSLIRQLLRSKRPNPARAFPSIVATINPALRTHGTRRALPSKPPCSFGQNSVSPSTGAIVRGPVGTSNPAAARRYPASKVSASGTGAACLPANRVIANPSAIVAPPPPAASGTQAWVAPASSSDCHSDAGHCPSSAALIKAAEHCSSSNRSTVSTMIGSG